MELAGVQLEAMTPGILEEYRVAGELLDTLHKFPEIYQHSIRVGALMYLLLPCVTSTSYLSSEELAEYALAATLHDVGKLTVPFTVLNKNGKLTHFEFSLVQYHTVCGSLIIRGLQEEFGYNSLLAKANELSLTHHENWNGTGYPNSIRCEEIPAVSQVAAIADSYDAVRSSRIYKPAKTHNEACKLLLETSGTRYNPEVLAEVLEYEDKLQLLYR